MMCEDAGEGNRVVFEFGQEDLAFCSSRVAGWESSYHTEVRSESTKDVQLCVSKYLDAQCIHIHTVCSILSCLPQFDALLLGRWEEAMRDGVFRYDLTEVASRTIPGQYGFVALVADTPTHTLIHMCNPCVQHPN